MLRLAYELLNETTPLTRVDIPETLRLEGQRIIGLGQLDQAHQVLTEACSLAKGLDAKPQLWIILVNLAVVNSKLENIRKLKQSKRSAHDHSADRRIPA